MLDIPDFAPRLIEEISDVPVIVLAPHMDDEIIGPGGTVVRHLRAGAKVTFVIMTDGMAGDPAARESLRDQRKLESRRAAEILGVEKLIFLDGPDGGLDDSPEIVASVEKILREQKGAIVYAPGLTDHHRDHWGDESDSAESGGSVAGGIGGESGHSRVRGLDAAAGESDV